jgi:16S rRNA (cytidine1402-2'-O)-methyltransferase
MISYLPTMALFIVSTPIGNLEDISLRALRVLKESDLILCEDTRKTKLLLSHYQINKPLESFYEQNEDSKINLILNLLRKGRDISLVSDAGTPLISDPGFKLVRAAVKEGLKVVSIPGASAALTALASSGLPTNQFFFAGFLPKKEGKQNTFLKFINLITETNPTTVIFYESPFRIEKTLKKLAEYFPEKELVVARELTKIHEEIVRGKAKDLAKTAIKAKGEFTILLY